MRAVLCEGLLAFADHFDVVFHVVGATHCHTPSLLQVVVFDTDFTLAFKRASALLAVRGKTSHKGQLLYVIGIVQVEELELAWNQRVLCAVHTVPLEELPGFSALSALVAVLSLAVQTGRVARPTDSGVGLSVKSAGTGELARALE